MRQYFYVEARRVDGVVSFAHCPVSARSESDAYERGARMLARLARMGLHRQSGHFGGAFENDYVVEVPSSRS